MKEKSDYQIILKVNEKGEVMPQVKFQSELMQRLTREDVTNVWNMLNEATNRISWALGHMYNEPKMELEL